MRRAPILLLALVAACASTPQGREVQYAQAIKTAQGSIVTALDFDIITPTQGEAAQAATRTATTALNSAVRARRTGNDRGWSVAMDAADKALREVARIVDGRN